ncbi:MAG TPA: glycoside hydrolase family 9 protein [Acidobacteriaceae bacterium]|nr:glycoside hydrolase family 9 protein [Acidobacteriaceae bacterium]
MPTCSILLRPKALLIAMLLATFPASHAQAQMKVTKNGYLHTRGFSVVLYQDTYHPVFVDQKDAAMQMILHGHRIATNGDIRLVPTPEQWDLVAKLKSRQADAEHNRLSAQLSFPSYHLDYNLVVTAEPGGVRVSVNLDKPLPKELEGRAGFNLEFLPSIYIGKSYAVDGTQFGVIPVSPQDRMHKVLPPPNAPKKLPYQEAWDKAKGYTQPYPLVTGKSITLAVGDPLYRVSVISDTTPLSLFDGRDRSQNGWFVLRTLIPSGKTQGAVVWHIHPNLIPNWTRPPMVSHSQVGYASDFPKVAIIELDPNFDAPKTARVLRLNEDGTYAQVFEGPISTPTPWLRYRYAKFDFSSVRAPGLYEIEYAGHRTHMFPIAKNVYSHTWQSTLDGFLAVEMDHVSVRDAYRLWHGVSHLDDARQAPPNTPHFDGYHMGPKTDSPYQPGQHIPGLNVGGWFDAGDYDNIAPSQYLVIENLSLSYREFGLKYDELKVDETARTVEMHRPDGVPDAVQQVKHGVLQVLAQIHAIGHPIMGIISPTLRQYTHLGDAASQTDGRIYSAKLGPNQVQGNYSGKSDDRWAFTTKLPFLQYGAAAALADASMTLRGWDGPLAKKCLDTAVMLWKQEHLHPTPMTSRPFGPPGMTQMSEWRAALELMLATHGGQPYKQRFLDLYPTAHRYFGFVGWRAVFALPYMNADFRKQFEASVRSYKAEVDTNMAKTPFGVPPSLGGWGNSAQVADFGSRMYFLHKAFPQIVGPEYTLRAANYLLGTHPASSTSYISSIGAVSKLKGYGNNRADGAFIPGGMIPGYVIIKPDFPECIDNFGFLWFEDEYTISAASEWILEANAANAVVD